VNNSKVPCTEEPPLKVFRADGTDEFDATRAIQVGTVKALKDAKKEIKKCVFFAHTKILLQARLLKTKNIFHFGFWFLPLVGLVFIRILKT
jgi:hypothetical protein